MREPKPIQLILFIAIAIFGLSLSQTVFAQAVASDFTWDQYTGTSHWRVDVTVDEGDCGGRKYTHRYTIEIVHNQDAAAIGDFGHGTLSGTFDGNVFTSPVRSFPDDGGTTTTSATRFDFTSDCSSFSGGYTWHYVGPGQTCDGPTTLKGTRTDTKDCQALADEVNQKIIVDAGVVLNDITQMQKEYDSESFEYNQHLFIDPNFMSTDKYEQMKDDLDAMDEELTTKSNALAEQYEDVLANDPDNFWANWDYAALKATRGDYGAADRMYYTAVSTLEPETRARVIADLQTSTQGRLSIVEKPTIETSPFIANIHNDIKSSWRQRLDVAIQKVMGDDELNAEKLTVTAVLAKMGGVYGRYKEYNECVSGSGGTTTSCVVSTLINK